MVMTDDPEKQEGLAKFMAFWLSPKIYGEWLGTSEPGLFLPVTDNAETNRIMFSAPVLSQFKKQHQMSLDEAPYTGMYGFMHESIHSCVRSFIKRHLMLFLELTQHRSGKHDPVGFGVISNWKEKTRL